MRTLVMLAVGLALLVGLWAIGNTVATAQVYSNDPKISLMDNCDPTAFLDSFCVASARLQTRFALQNLLLQCMQEQRLDALVSPMSTVPPRKLTAPREPNANGRAPIGWSLIGQQGFPAITVPAGFTTEIWDRVRDANGSTRLVGPVQANLPVGVDFIARPFDEATLFRIASAFEAATRHRKPPVEFGPLPGEP